MRRLIAAVILTGVAACSSSKSVSPDVATINVRVLDDAGGPINRTRIIVSMGADRIDELTNSSGVASIRVANLGEYSVRVLPRIGYAGGSGPIVKSVTVGTSTASVAFTLMRDAVTQGTPRPPGDNPTQTWW